VEGEGVKKGRVISVLGSVAIATALLCASTASAATLIGDYQFQGTRASSGPGPTLLDVGGVNSFQSDSVLGTSRQVLRFPLHSGVQMFPAGIGGSTAPYSAVTTFKLDTITGYRRILDPTTGQTIDRGIYDYNGKALIYSAGEDVTSPQIVFAPNTYATVAVTSAPPTQLKVFVNGSLVAQAAQANQMIPVESDTLRFFKDNDVPPNNQEDSAGAVSCIRVFSGLLTDAEVAAIGVSPTCGTVAAPPVVKKKCKKHKKKRSAELAKKKKCKKKKKR
jgi:concanavalin A-like lectin/glucanase superfamily protein